MYQLMMLLLSSVVVVANLNVNIIINNKIVNSTLLKDKHACNIKIVIKNLTKTITLNLNLNQGLLSADYREKVLIHNGSYYLNNKSFKDFCYYVGNVEGENDSSTAFTTCPFIRGSWRIGDETWYISETPAGTYTANTNTNNALWYQEISRMRHHLEWRRPMKRIKRNAVGYDDKLVVELYIVNDNSIYKMNSEDERRVASVTKDIVNNVNLMYQTVGVQVMLVGMETWADSDLIEMSSNAYETNDHFLKYRFESIDKYNDNAYLISGTAFNSGILGVAHLGTMCTQTRSGGILTGIHKRNDVTAAILAHEMGHNLGMSHDQATCQCETVTVGCIMNSRASPVRSGSHFSSCSKKHMKNLQESSLDVCLHNKPHTFIPLPGNICGNGVVETGEECDCGRLPSHICRSLSCSSECKLRTACSQGGCCNLQTGELQVQGHICRPVRSTCDLPEKCDGASATCPYDVFFHTATPCILFQSPGFCFDGVCQSRISQCKKLYGDESSDGIPSCYTFNRIGSEHGFCQRKIFHNGSLTFTPCADEHKDCGSLQCGTHSVNLIKSYNFILLARKSFNKSPCNSAIIDVGTHTIDPSFVPNGSPCGSEKSEMCLNRQCVPVEYIYTTNPCPQCKHGNCGNDGKCHCDMGWNGIKCDSTQNQQPTQTTHQQTTHQQTTQISSGTFDNNTTSKSVREGVNTTIISGVAVLVVIVLLLIIIFIYDHLHKKHITSFFKSNKQNIVENIGRLSTMKPWKYNPQYNEDSGMDEITSEYVNNSQVNDKQTTYNYNQSQVILNSNMLTPPSAYPPDIHPTFLQNNDIKPPVPDSSLKPPNISQTKLPLSNNINVPQTTVKTTKPSNLHLSQTTLEPNNNINTHVVANLQTFVHLDDLNNNIHFSKLKSKLNN